ncbi:MAG: hypothetical protein ABR536_05000 [Solirubrobacterales bacterium]
MRRQMGKELQLLYAAAALLALGAAFITFVLTEHTADYWSWAISPPISAAFLGGCYCAAVALLWPLSRVETWAEGRLAATPVMTISLMLLATTLIHWDRFDQDHLVFWLWFAAYVLVPPVLAVLVVKEISMPGQIVGSGEKLPWWAVAGLWLHGMVLLGVGVVMFLAPGTAADFWPWQLSELTSRALGSFIFGFGVNAVAALFVNDLRLLRVPGFAYAVLGLAELVAVARYSGEVDFDTVGLLYVAFLVSAVLGGLTMIYLSRDSTFRA